MDRVAFWQASRYSGRYTVTLSVDQVTFKARASVNHVGTDIPTLFYDGGRRPEVPDLHIETTTDARRNRAAELRRIDARAWARWAQVVLRLQT
jgi:hypothetical protein